MVVYRGGALFWGPGGTLSSEGPQASHFLSGKFPQEAQPFRWSIRGLQSTGERLMGVRPAFFTSSV